MKQIEYEDEDELPKDLETDELDFEDGEIRPVVNGSEPKKVIVTTAPVKQPVKKVQAKTPEKPEQPGPTEEEQPQEPAITIEQYMIAMANRIEELYARVTKIESDLYRQR